MVKVKMPYLSCVAVPRKNLIDQCFLVPCCFGFYQTHGLQYVYHCPFNTNSSFRLSLSVNLIGSPLSACGFGTTLLNCFCFCFAFSIPALLSNQCKCCSDLNLELSLFGTAEITRGGVKLLF